MILEFSGGREVRISAKHIRGNNMPRCHSHDSCELYFLTSGERYLFVKDRFFSVKEGDIFLISPGVEHRTLDSDGSEYSRITANIPLSLIPSGVLPDSDIYFVRPDESALAALRAEAELIYNSESETAVFASVMKMLSVLLSSAEHREISQISSPTLARMANILAYLDTHYADGVTLTALSEKFFISPYYLCRLFKEYTGRTILGYLTQLRVRRAKSLLKSTRHKLNVIAAECGFGSVSAFSAAFKKETGLSPREYRGIDNAGVI